MFEIEESDSVRVRREKKTRKGILETILGSEGNVATMQDLIDTMNLSRHTIEKHIAFLVGANLVDSAGTAYYVTPEGKAQIIPKDQKQEET